MSLLFNSECYLNSLTSSVMLLNKLRLRVNDERLSSLELTAVFTRDTPIAADQPPRRSLRLSGDEKTSPIDELSSEFDTSIATHACLLRPIRGFIGTLRYSCVEICLGQ